MKHEKEGQLGVECGCDVHSSCSLREKKEWGDKYPLNTFEGETRVEIISFIESLLEAEREKWRLKNAGLYRQLFAEMNDRTFTAKELWKIFDEHTPLFTEEQKKELKEHLNSIMK